MNRIAIDRTAPGLPLDEVLTSPTGPTDPPVVSVTRIRDKIDAAVRSGTDKLRAAASASTHSGCLLAAPDRGLRAAAGSRWRVILMAAPGRGLSGPVYEALCEVAHQGFSGGLDLGQALGRLAEIRSALSNGELSGAAADLRKRAAIQAQADTLERAFLHRAFDMAKPELGVRANALLDRLEKAKPEDRPHLAAGLNDLKNALAGARDITTAHRAEAEIALARLERAVAEKTAFLDKQAALLAKAGILTGLAVAAKFLVTGENGKARREMENLGGRCGKAALNLLENAAAAGRGEAPLARMTEALAEIKKSLDGDGNAFETLGQGCSELGKGVRGMYCPDPRLDDAPLSLARSAMRAAFSDLNDQLENRLLPALRHQPSEATVRLGEVALSLMDKPSEAVKGAVLFHSLGQEADAALRGEGLLGAISADRVVSALDRLQTAVTDNQTLFNDSERAALGGMRVKLSSALTEARAAFDQDLDVLKRDLAAALARRFGGARRQDAPLSREEAGRIIAELSRREDVPLNQDARKAIEEISRKVTNLIGQWRTLRERAAQRGADAPYSEARLQELEDMKAVLDLETFKLDVGRLGLAVKGEYTLSGLRGKVLAEADDSHQAGKLGIINAFSGKNFKALLDKLNEETAPVLSPKVPPASEEEVSARLANLEKKLSRLEKGAAILLIEDDRKSFTEKLNAARREAASRSVENLTGMEHGRLAALRRKLGPDEHGLEQRAMLDRLLNLGSCHALLCGKLADLGESGLKALLTSLVEAGKSPEHTDKAMRALDGLTLDSVVLDKVSLDMKLSLDPAKTEIDREIITDRHINVRLKRHLLTQLSRNGGLGLLKNYGVQNASDLNTKKLTALVQGLGAATPQGVEILLAKTLWSDLALEAKLAGREPDFKDLRALLPAAINQAWPDEEQLQRAFDLGMPSLRDLNEAGAMAAQASSLFTSYLVNRMTDNLIRQGDDHLRAHDAMTQMLRNWDFAADSSSAPAVKDIATGDIVRQYLDKTMPDEDYQKGLVVFLGRHPEVTAIMTEARKRESESVRLRAELDQSLASRQREICERQGVLKDGSVQHTKLKGDTLSCLILGLDDILRNEPDGAGATYGDERGRLEAYKTFKLPDIINLQAMQTSQNKIVGRLSVSEDALGKEFRELLKEIRTIGNVDDPGQRDKFLLAEGRLRAFLDQPRAGEYRLGADGHTLMDDAIFILAQKSTRGRTEEIKTRDDLHGRTVTVKKTVGGVEEAWLRGFSKAFFGSPEREGAVAQTSARDGQAFHGPASLRETIYRRVSRGARPEDSLLTLRGSGQRRDMIQTVVVKDLMKNLEFQSKKLQTLLKPFSREVRKALEGAAEFALLEAFTKQKDQFKTFGDAEKSLRESADLSSHALVAGAAKILSQDFGLDEKLAETMILSKIAPVKRNDLNLNAGSLLAAATDGIKTDRGLLFTRIIENTNASLTSVKGGLQDAMQFFARSDKERREQGLEKSSALLRRLEPGQVFSIDKEAGFTLAGTASVGALEVGAALRLARENGISFSRSVDGKGYEIAIRRNDSLGIGVTVGLDLGAEASVSVGARGQRDEGVVLGFEDLEACEGFMQRLFQDDFAPADLTRCGRIQTFTEDGVGGFARAEVSSPKFLRQIVDGQGIGLNCGVEFEGNVNSASTVDHTANTTTVVSERMARLTFDMAIGVEEEKEKSAPSAEEAAKALDRAASAGRDSNEAASVSLTGENKSLNPRGVSARAGLDGTRAFFKASKISTFTSSVTRSNVDQSLQKALLLRRMDFAGPKSRPELHEFLVGALSMKDEEARNIADLLSTLDEDAFELELEHRLTEGARGAINELEKSTDPERDRKVRDIMNDSTQYELSKMKISVKIGEQETSLPPPLNAFFTMKATGAQLQTFKVNLDSLRRAA